MPVKYYLISDGRSLVKVDEHEYFILLLETGEWVQRQRLADKVLIEADTKEVTVKQAQRWLKAAAPELEIIWD